MNIELLRAYDEANKLRESGKSVPEYLLKRIKKLEKDLISWDLIPRIEDLFDYILEGYESPVSLNINFYPGTNEIIIDDLSPKEKEPTAQKKSKSADQPKKKDAGSTPKRPFNTFNQYIVEPHRPQRSNPLSTSSEKKKDSDPQNKRKEESVSSYSDAFRKMKDTSGAIGINKAVMLLTIFKLIECGYIKTNWIEFDNTLIIQFGHIWDSSVPKERRFEKNACQPFVKLLREPFYHLELKENKRGIEIDKDWDIKSLRSIIKYAFFDYAFFSQAKNKSTRNELMEDLVRLFSLKPKVLQEEIKIIRQQPIQDTRFLKESISIEERPEFSIDNFVLSSRIAECNQNELNDADSSVLYGAVAIAYSSNKRNSYVIYDPALRPLTKENIVRFMLKALVTRVLLGYKYNSKIPTPNKIEDIESLLSCTVFQEVDIYSSKKTNYFLTMNRLITSYQIYTEFDNIKQRIYDAINGNTNPELPEEFNYFVKNVAKQSFEKESYTKQSK